MIRNDAYGFERLEVWVLHQVGSEGNAFYHGVYGSPREALASMSTFLNREWLLKVEWKFDESGLIGYHGSREVLNLTLATVAIQ